MSVWRRLTHRETGPASAWVVIAMVGLAAACSPSIHSTIPRPPTAQELAELWDAPSAGRDLFWGVGGKRLAPDPSVTYKVIQVKTSGFSKGYDIVGPDKREWSAKFPPEASTEIVASRIHWGIGYHQPPNYYVAKWSAEKAPAANPQPSARFREKKPDFHGLDDVGTWSYFQNPFVGTVHLKGLIVLQAMQRPREVRLAWPPRLAARRRPSS